MSRNSKLYDGENHYFHNQSSSTVNIRPLQGQTLNIYAGSYNIIDGGLNQYTASTLQNIGDGVNTRVLFPAASISDITNLEKTTVSGGSVFTNVGTTTMRLLVTYSITNNLEYYTVLNSNIYINDTGIRYAPCISTGVNQCNNGTCVLVLEPNDYFTLWCLVAGDPGTISDGVANSSVLSVYSLS